MLLIQWLQISTRSGRRSSECDSRTPSPSRSTVFRMILLLAASDLDYGILRSSVRANSYRSSNVHGGALRPKGILRANCSSSVQECQSGSPKCVWHNQQLHRSAILGGDNHARPLAGRNALTEYPARPTFFFAWSFSSADVIPEAQLTNSSSRSLHRRLPTAALRPCFCSAGRQSPLLMIRKCQEFREFVVAGPTEQIVLGHDFLPAENSS